MSCFEKIELLLQNNPNLEELTVMFITDGQDGYFRRPASFTGVDPYDLVRDRIRAIPGLKSRFLAVGFSSYHDAAFMNRIANFGTEQGNFIFIDSSQGDWRDELNQSLIDSMDIALESNAKVKFAITNDSMGFAQENRAEIQYVARQNL